MAAKHYVVYSHGFGVKKDDRGLFSDISAALPGQEHILFDYNQIDEANNILTVSPLQDQVQQLRAKLAGIEDDSTIDLIAHSQGCLVAALARPERVRKILFLAPPDNVDVDSLINFFGDRPGSVIDLEGESRVPRRDGSTTIIPAEYWKSLRPLNPIRIYNHLPETAEITFYIATNDEVLGTSHFDAISERIDLVDVDANHDFTDDARKEVISLIKVRIGQ